MLTPWIRSSDVILTSMPLYMYDEIELLDNLCHGQRQVNITRQTISPKSGLRKCRKYKNKRPTPIGHK